MRQQILLCLATLGLSMQVYGAKPVSDIEGLRVRERFRYGVHHLRWDQDVNGNQIMEFGEVSTSADAGKTWNLLEDEGVFKSTVGSRRQTREDPQPGVVFKSVPGRDLSLHIHYPEDWNASDRRSVILWFHGGGFAGGNPVQFQKFCEHFAELGIVNIRVAYRLRVLDNANGGGFDAAKDGRSAIRWVRQHAAELGIAPNRVIAGGDSAGGALALATCRNDLDDPDDDLSISAVPNAILGESAWVLLHKPGIEDRSLVWPLLTLQELPPIWLGYGGEDIGYKASSPLGGEAFVAALKAKGADLSVHIIPEGKHGYGFRPHFFPRCLESMEQFLIKHEFLPLAAQTSNTRVIVDDDFEQGVVKSVTVTHSGEKSGYRLHAPTPRLRCMFPATDPEDRAGVEVTTVRAAAGKQSLKLINASTKQLAHHAGLIWWLDRLKEDVRSGVLNISFDILIPEKNGNDLSLMTRDYSLHPPAHMIGMNVSKENVAFGGRKAAVTPGTWVHCEMALPMGVAEGTAVVKVVDTKLGSRVLEQPLDKVQQVNWIYFMMAGKQDAHLFLDNLKIVVKNELPVAEPVEEMLNITRKEDTAWQATPSVMLDLFPESVASVPEASQGKTRMSATYKASGSLWGEGLNEEWVFHREIRHVQDKDNSYALRIGKGGQLYSLRGPFGETVPPSSLGTPWNDEVWQFVAVCQKYNWLRGGGLDAVAERIVKTGYQYNYFIHNSGAYVGGNGTEGANMDNLYCPLLGTDAPAGGRTYRTLNWGLLCHLKTISRSPILYYVQTRDVGDGVIEVTYVVHNFDVRDDIVFDHLNAPWGGTRTSRLPFIYVSKPDGTLIGRSGYADFVHGQVDVRKTGGWGLNCASDAPDSPSLAFVYGRDRHLEREQEKAESGQPHMQTSPSTYNHMNTDGETDFANQDWATRPEQDFRNYDVAVVIPRFSLAPGRTIWYRSYLVINRRDRAIELATSLVDKVDYGELIFDPEATPMVPVYTRGDRVVDGENREHVPAFQLFAKPVPGTKPLFLVENATTGRQVITTDPYVFVPTEKLPDVGFPKDDDRYDYYTKDLYGYSMHKNNSKWQRLLGYGYVEKPKTGSYEKLSAVVGKSLTTEPDRFKLDLWVQK